jgi:hypothetical protein
LFPLPHLHNQECDGNQQYHDNGYATPYTRFRAGAEPWVDGAAVSLEVSDALAVGLKDAVIGVTMIEAGFGATAVPTARKEDEAAVGASVTANRNTLEETLQQLFSPQHRSLSLHFYTSAFSTCHYVKH